MNISILQQGTDMVLARLGNKKPFCAIVLGSGWGEVSSGFETLTTLDYSDIPNLGASGIKGHSGKLLLAHHSGQDLLVFQGRRHWYEGCGWEPIAFPVYLSAIMGVKAMILTNAAGGIRADLEPGSLMVVEDHINAMGVNPLVGEHAEVWGPRFPDQSQTYDKDLIRMVDAAAKRAGERIHHGVYAAVPGPSYETPAEVKALRTLGADAVGMSTVPEAILAHSAGMRVMAISCIANSAAGIATERLLHEDVLKVTALAQSKMHTLLCDVVGNLAASPTHK